MDIYIQLSVRLLLLNWHRNIFLSAVKDNCQKSAYNYIVVSCEIVSVLFFNKDIVLSIYCA